MRHDGNGERSRGRATGGSEAKRKHARDTLARARSPGMRSRRGETRWRWGAETRRVPQPPRVRPCTPWSRLDERMRRGRGASRRAEKRGERSERARVRAGVLATGQSCGNTEARRARVCARLGVRGASTNPRNRAFFRRAHEPAELPSHRRREVKRRHWWRHMWDAFAAKCAAVRGRARRGKRHISPRGVAATPRCPSRWTSSWCRARRS